jgi:hypothetical protein
MGNEKTPGKQNNFMEYRKPNTIFTSNTNDCLQVTEVFKWKKNIVKKERETIVMKIKYSRETNGSSFIR